MTDGFYLQESGSGMKWRIARSALSWAAPAFILICGSVLPRWVQARNPTRAEALKSVQPLMSRTEVPRFYALLDHWGEPLAQAVNEALQEKLGPSAERVPFEWHISNKDDVNAAFQLVGGARGEERRAVVVVNRGFILEVFGDALQDPGSPGKRERAGKRLLGALQHEFAHALDKLDPGGIEKTHASRNRNGLARLANDLLTRQSIELKTDLLATDLAYRAGQPRDAVYETQAFLESISPAVDGSVAGIEESYFNTHPHGAVRTSASRLTLVGNRFKRGVPPEKGFALPLNLEKALKRGTSWNIRFRQYETIDEVIQDLRSFKGKNDYKSVGTEGARDSSLQFTHARKSLEELIHDRGARITTDERKLIIEFYADFIKNPGNYLFGNPAGAFSKEAPESFPKGHPGHDLHPRETGDLIGDSVLFRDPEFREELRRSLRTDFMQKLGGEVVRVDSYREYLGVGTMLELFDRELREYYLNGLRGLKQERSIRGSERIIGLLQNDQASRWFHERVLPELTDLERQMLHLRLKIIDVSQDSLLKRIISTQNEESARRLFSGKPPVNRDVLEFYRTQARYYWQNRGLYGVLDFLAQGEVNWELAWKLLDIDPAKADRS